MNQAPPLSRFSIGIDRQGFLHHTAPACACATQWPVTLSSSQAQDAGFSSR